MSQPLKLLLLAPVWGFAAWGSLKLHTLDLDWGHSICGPWGCGPPLEALLGYHAFWLTLLGPVAIGAGFYMGPVVSKRVGLVVTTAAFVLMVVIAGKATHEFWVASGNTQYLVQKFFFTIATNVDVPMVQILASGLLLCAVGMAGKSKPQSAATSSHETTQANPV